MAHLWLHDGCSRHSTDIGWSPMPLDTDVHVLRGGTLESGSSAASDDDAMLRRCNTPDGEQWVIVATGPLRVNGRPLDTGIAVLRDRDELSVGGRRAYFSTEVVATIEPAPVTDRSVACPRCKLLIEPGSPSVVCPGCKVRYHQKDPELPCWTYAPTCAVSDWPTALGAGYRWVPDEP